MFQVEPDQHCYADGTLRIKHLLFFLSRLFNTRMSLLILTGCKKVSFSNSIRQAKSQSLHRNCHTYLLFRLIRLPYLENNYLMTGVIIIVIFNTFSINRV